MFFFVECTHRDRWVFIGQSQRASRWNGIYIQIGSGGSSSQASSSWGKNKQTQIQKKEEMQFLFPNSMFHGMVHSFPLIWFAFQQGTAVIRLEFMPTITTMNTCKLWNYKKELFPQEMSTCNVQQATSHQTKQNKNSNIFPAKVL